MGQPTSLDALLGSDWRAAAERRRAEILGRVAGRTEVVLFGAGYLGRHAGRDLEGLPFTPRAFVDNDPTHWHSEVDGLPVLSPDEAQKRFADSALWLITVYTNSAVIAQCEAMRMPWVTCAELSWVLPEPRPASFIFGAPEQLAMSEDAIVAAASIWADEDSATEYQTQVRWRFLLDYGTLRPPRPMTELYFPSDLVKPLDAEVFVDCGAFTGDTLDTFLSARAGRFDRMIAIEPDPLNRAALRARLQSWDPAQASCVRVEPFAVGAERGTLRFKATGTAGSTVGSGTESVDVAPLDELLADRPPTYIKMDVEGAERDALLGGAKTIRANAPVLAICLYHKPEDLWDLPLLIQSLRPDYRLYVRRHSDERWETVCYAIPPDRVVQH